MELVSIKEEYDNFYVIEYKTLFKNKKLKVFNWYGDVRRYDNGQCLSYSLSTAIITSIQVMKDNNFYSLDLK